jgi:stearoyl-CoA desaturase (delta-9 desaturase)
MTSDSGSTAFSASPRAQGWTPSVVANVAIFWTVQATALGAFLVHPTRPLLALAAVSYGARMLGITLAFHRHLAHRAFRMGRGARFFWAWLGTSAMQKGPLWWAGNHLYHHRYADREGDPHSPLLGGFYHAHIGWFLDDVRWDGVDEANPVVREFSRYPEIRFLERHYGIPPSLLALGLYLYGGLPWLVWGFCVPTVLLAHATFAINSVNHLWGSRRFATADDSRNNPWTALVTFGEGWHNNHHRFPRAARNGFFWWEWDPTYWTIRLMRAVGLASAVESVPARVYEEVGSKSAAGPAPSPAFEGGEAEANL